MAVLKIPKPVGPKNLEKTMFKVVDKRALIIPVKKINRLFCRISFSFLTCERRNENLDICKFRIKFDHESFFQEQFNSFK